MYLGRRMCRFGENDPKEVLALMQEYGISARLTFSNSLLKEKHFSDRKCNALCALLEENKDVQNGVIVHSAQRIGAWSMNGQPHSTKAVSERSI